MSLLDVANFGADFSVIMSVISCLLIIRVIPVSDKRLQSFFIYLIIGLVAGVVSYFTRKIGNNALLGYIHTPLGFIFSSLIFFPEKSAKTLRYLVVGLMILVVGITTYEALILEGGIKLYNSLSGVLSSIIVGFLAIRSLIKMRFNSSIVDLASEPMFWIATAFAIMNIANILADGFYRTFQQMEGDTLLKLVFTSMCVNYISTIVYWIGLWKVKKNASRKIPNLAT